MIRRPFLRQYWQTIPGGGRVLVRESGEHKASWNVSIRGRVTERARQMHGLVLGSGTWEWYKSCVLDD